MTVSLVNPLLTAYQAAEVLNVHYRTVLELRKAGELPAVAIGGTWRFDPDDIQTYINNNKENTHA